MRALIVHIGAYEAGHFVTVVRRDDMWYLIDDEKVTLVKELPRDFSWRILLGRIASLLSEASERLRPRLALYEKENN